MQAALLGRKIGMTQVYDESGSLQSVTVVQAGPCHVSQIKTTETDGYDAVQLSFERLRPHRARKPVIGHAARGNTKPARHYREVRLDAAEAELNAGDEVTVAMFEGVTWVDVTGTSKGKGFAGTMKRHNFRGQGATHGTERKHRSPGSISSHGTYLGGAGGPKKGKKMAGQLGNVRTTSRGHKLVGIDAENNLLLIKGSVPGANGGLVFVRSGLKERAKAAKA